MDDLVGDKILGWRVTKSKKKVNHLPIIELRRNFKKRSNYSDVLIKVTSTDIIISMNGPAVFADSDIADLPIVINHARMMLEGD